jgi:hypothetical protein
MKQGRFASMICELYTLDPAYTADNVDRGEVPRVNFRPDLIPEFGGFPRIICYSCDKGVVSQIMNGLIPGR